MDFVAYCGTVNGRKTMFCAKTRTRAIQKGASYIERCQSLDCVLEREFTRRQLIDAANAIELAAARNIGMTLSEIVAEFSRIRRAMPPRQMPQSFESAFRLFLGAIPPERERSIKTYRSLFNIMTRAKASARREPGSKGGREPFPALDSQSRGGAAAIGRRGAIPPDTPLDNIAESDFARVLDSYSSPVTRNSLLRRAKAFFSWAVRNGYLHCSPIARLRPALVPFREPAFFAPDKVAAIFRILEASACDPGIGMFFTLGFFAGMRTSEILRARWRDIVLEDGFIRVPEPKGITNNGKPRIVELEPNAVAWMRRFTPAATAPDERIVRKPNAVRQWKLAHLEPRGLSWGNDANHNVMRHTFATMHVAAFRDAAATSLLLGNTQPVLDRHYKGLTTRASASLHWAILPSRS